MRGGDRHSTGRSQNVATPALQRVDPVNFGLSPVDNGMQIHRPQRARVERFAHGPGDLMPAAGAVHHLTPPLPSDHRRHRLTHQIARTGDLMVEGIQRK